MALTDTEIKKAKTKGKAYGMGDGSGLYLWITPVGGKLWRWACRYQGKEKAHVIREVSRSNVCACP